jgi:hypothetical protein
MIRRSGRGDSWKRNGGSGACAGGTDDAHAAGTLLPFGGYAGGSPMIVEGGDDERDTDVFLSPTGEMGGTVVETERVKRNHAIDAIGSEAAPPA